MNPIFASAISPEVLIVAGVIVLLFGGSQLPKLARSLGQAKQEFEKTQQKDEPKKDNNSANGNGNGGEPPAQN
jgi:sec-independent protein translocase protein TatA